MVEARPGEQPERLGETVGVGTYERHADGVGEVGQNRGDQVFPDEVGFERVPPTTPGVEFVCPAGPAVQGDAVSIVEVRQGLEQVGGLQFVLGAGERGQGGDPGLEHPVLGECGGSCGREPVLGFVAQNIVEQCLLIGGGLLLGLARTIRGVNSQVCSDRDHQWAGEHVCGRVEGGPLRQWGVVRPAGGKRGEGLVNQGEQLRPLLHCEGLIARGRARVHRPGSSRATRAADAKSLRPVVTAPRRRANQQQHPHWVLGGRLSFELR